MQAVVLLKDDVELVELALLALFHSEIGWRSRHSNLVVHDRLVELYVDDLFAEIVGNELDKLRQVCVVLDLDHVRRVAASYQEEVVFVNACSNTNSDDNNALGCCVLISIC